jgi:Lrp/AsnC family transcriptional regulator for asnA, asnC and gidA
MVDTVMRVQKARRTKRTAERRTALDELDRALMDLLREDGRRPAIDLAKELRVSEATVRKRMNRLIKGGLLRILAVSNLTAMGYTQEIMLLVRTEPGRTLEVAEALAQHTCVRFLAVGLGPFDLFVNAVFRGPEDLRAFVFDELHTCAGVQSVQSFQVLSILKRTYDWLAKPAPRDA